MKNITGNLITAVSPLQLDEVLVVITRARLTGSFDDTLPQQKPAQETPVIAARYQHKFRNPRSISRTLTEASVSAETKPQEKGKQRSILLISL